MDKGILRDYFLLRKDFLNIEYPPSFDNYDILRIRIHNVAGVLAIILGFFILVGDIYEQDFLRILFTFIYMFGIPLGLSLSSKGYFTAAKVFSINWYAGLATLLAIIWGKQLGSQFTYLITSMLVITFFGKRLNQHLGISLVLAYFFIGELYLHFNPPLIDKEFSQLNYYIFFTSTVWAITLFSKYYLNSHRFLYSQTIKLLDNLVENNASLEHKNKEFERFAYIASHDFKTPLRQVISFLGLIKRKIANHPEQEDISDYMTYASEGASRMYHIIEDLLEYSVIGNTQQANDIQVLDLNKIILEITQGLEVMMVEKNIVVTTNQLPIMHTQHLLIHSIFQNLIENGLKYNTSDQPRVHIQYEQQTDKHYFYVQDNGIGIEPEYHQRIFEMFKRLHTIDEYQGSGIGLAICQRAVKLLGGTITLSSNPDHGSTFVLSFTDPDHQLFH